MRSSARRSLTAPQESGFSLIEVLVSFVLLSLALTVILQIFSTNLRSMDTVRKQTRALVLAESKLAAVGKEIPLTPGELTGKSGDFNWQLNISLYADQTEEDERGLYGLYDVAMTVNWSQGAETPEFRLRTLRVGAAR